VFEISRSFWTTESKQEILSVDVKREVLRHDVLPRQEAANTQCSKQAKFDLMSVRMPGNARVTERANESVSLLISEHQGLVGNPAVSSDALQCIAQSLRRRHDVVKEADFARIEIAGQREAEKIIL